MLLLHLWVAFASAPLVPASYRVRNGHDWITPHVKHCLDPCGFVARLCSSLKARYKMSVGLLEQLAWEIVGALITRLHIYNS